MSADDITDEVIALLQNAPHHNRELPAEQEAQDFRAQQLAFHAACEELCKRIRATKGTAAFDALFWLACLHGNPEKGEPDFAAHILFYVRPRCPLSCEEAVRAVALSQWNASVEEVPWYLVAHFGSEAVSAAVAAVESEAFVVEIQRQGKLWFHEMERRHGRERIYQMKGLPVMPGRVASERLGTISYWLDFYVLDSNKPNKWMPSWKRH